MVHSASTWFDTPQGRSMSTRTSHRTRLGVAPVSPNSNKNNAGVQPRASIDAQIMLKRLFTALFHRVFGHGHVTQRWIWQIFWKPVHHGL